ncbi:unnamed protein product, partial [Mesorhabditis belari]|uniref:SAM domain-containing protein n=1 Tax=Mesorhabditis belari TaxID=2138241 RepID=A0AAF3FGU7_9BILA
MEAGVRLMNETRMDSPFGMMDGEENGTQEPLPPGWIEHKLQVDRKRLEAMITGSSLQGSSIYLPNAEDFFKKVEKISAATVCWPSKLKIGAKTKKDPYVKILGLPDQVDCARQLIAATLQVKRDRVTLKMEIEHSAHSHIIGRGGRGSQAVMKHTGCHVHFPDGNKYSEDLSKSDQVSIAGSASQVEMARRLLRELCPIVITFDVPWLLPTPPNLPPTNQQVNIVLKKTSDCVLSCALRGCAGQESAFLEAIDLLSRLLHMHSEMPILCRVGIELRPSVTSALHKPSTIQKLESLCTQWCVHIEWPHSQQGPFQPLNSINLSFKGPLKGCLKARKFMMGMLSVSLQFDQSPSISQVDFTAIENDFGITVQTKAKTVQGGEQVSFVLRGSEEKIVDLLRARQRILGQEQSEAIDDDYAFMKNQINDSSTPFSRSLVGRGSTLEDIVQDIPLSPDPDDSPIAHSLLTSAKNINGNAELWTGQPASRRASREQMLRKAHQAIYESIDASVRYPTDFWSGYGFSSSLPADLLKGMLDLNAKEQAEKTKGQTSGAPGSGSAKGLPSVREEEEDQSSLSASSSSLSNTLTTRVFHKKTKTPAFSASTSIFESPLGTSESAWDIASFIEPSMVLAQLGLSEYTANLRDQEIDMDAFLLLDEAALRDIGVATVGARKKIHHAILKLRESAKSQGYSL